MKVSDSLVWRAIEIYDTEFECWQRRDWVSADQPCFAIRFPRLRYESNRAVELIRDAPEMVRLDKASTFHQYRKWRSMKAVLESFDSESLAVMKIEKAK